MPTPYTVLIVDDDEDDKEMFIEAIAEINGSISLLTASNGYQALQLLNNPEAVPDVIFLDLNMPRMGGKQCLQKIKQDARLASIPVIIFSTSNIEEEKEETKKLGAHSFITKPSCMKHLKDELGNILTVIPKT